MVAAHETELRKRPRVRKARGAYYTPRIISERLAADTIGAAVAAGEVAASEITVLDPACGAGAMLVAAYEAIASHGLGSLIAARRTGELERTANGFALPRSARAEILASQIFGCDVDEGAVAAARRALAVAAFGERAAEAPDLGGHLRVANAVLDPLPASSFDVVIGNPPWGQKRIATTPEIKATIRARCPSARGIFDWFRPFVELGIGLTRPGGWFGMVLPDIVLLKNYEATRKVLLDELALSRIAWLGRAFEDAAIDVVTIAGQRAAAPPGHHVQVFVTGDPPLSHAIEQATFRKNPRSTLNLRMTSARREIIDALASFPRLGQVCEIHEGVHSGNIRRDLFVDHPVDDSCRPLYVGRGELSRFHLEWRGTYLRGSAIPAHKTRRRYAHVGPATWYERPKILVRRTGDRLIAAVDTEARYASNNFFVVFSRASDSPEGLDALCAILNSALATWWFRVIEPRTGRPFAEVKVKHLAELPVLSASHPAFSQLASLGARRRRMAAADGSLAAALDEKIDRTVAEAFGVSSPLP